MGKEDLRHRGARTSRELLHNLQSFSDRARRERVASLDSGHQPPQGEYKLRPDPYLGSVLDGEEVIFFRHAKTQRDCE